MKQFFTSFLVGIGIIAGAWNTSLAAEQKVGSVDSYSYAVGDAKPATPSSTSQKFYNASGQLSYEIDAYGGLSTYTYNEAGLLIETISYYMSSDLKVLVFSSKTAYEYDEFNQLIQSTSLNEAGGITGYTLYENYINGEYQDSKSMSADGSTIYYWQQFEHTFDGSTLVSTIKKYKPDEETDAVILGKSEFSYDNGLLIGDVYSAYLNGVYDNTADNSYVIDYTYDVDGNLLTMKNTSISRWGDYVSEYEYNYNDYSADYTPLNVVAQSLSGEGIAPNTVQLSWDASTSVDVTGYMIFVDELIDGVITGTSYTTSSLTNGEHTFGVIAVVNNKTSNASELVKLTVSDAGVIPAEDLVVVSIGAYDDVNYGYPVEVSWNAPVTNSVVTGYRVYYSAYSYADFTETSGTVIIPSWYAEGTDEYGDVIGLDVNLYVVAIYNTGIADPSNTVTVNAVDGTYTDIDEEINYASVSVFPNPATDYINFSDDVSVTIYSLAGKIVLASNNYVSHLDISSLYKGIYIVETKTVEGYKAITKVIVK